MSTVGSEHVFLTALQPNTSVTTYALPSEIKVGNGGSVSDDSAKARRVQQQIQMRLAEKSTLPRQNGSTSHYAMSGKHQWVFKSLSHGVTPTLFHCSVFPIESCCVRWSVFSAHKWRNYVWQSKFPAWRCGHRCFCCCPTAVLSDTDEFLIRPLSPVTMFPLVLCSGIIFYELVAVDLICHTGIR